jgi:hypothetical protein
LPPYPPEGGPLKSPSGDLGVINVPTKWSSIYEIYE